MTESTHTVDTTSTNQSSLLPPIVITIAVSAFLLFLIQPLVAKQILPWFGGSSTVWTTCMLFFQALLLAGYAYANWSTHHLSVRMQGIVHLSLLAISLVWLPPMATKFGTPTIGGEPIGQILWLLFLMIGLPYAVLSSTSPLLQSWLAGRLGQQVKAQQVYRLFALSNLGSLLGLLCYPFLIEPFFAMQTQAVAWAGFYLLFAGSCAWVAWKVKQSAADANPTAPQVSSTQSADQAAKQSGAEAAPTLLTRARWVVLAMIPSVMLLTNTSHLTQNIASVPFLWIVPLVLYLLSFVLVFEGRGGKGWYSREAWLPFVAVMLVMMAWGLTTSAGVLPLALGMSVYLGGLFVVCMFCHGELALDKPASRYLTQFYLAMSVGGVLGGVLVGIVAPLLFNGYWEMPLGIIAAALVLCYAHRDSRWFIGAMAAIVIVAVVMLGIWVYDGSTFDNFRANFVIFRRQYVVHISLLVISVMMFLALRARAAVGIASACLVLSVAWGWAYINFQYDNMVSLTRNFYGVVRVRNTMREQIPVRAMSHGSILHGEQVLDPDRKLTPTTYYGRVSGVGKAIEAAQAVGSTKICMIGLGVGTVAGYGRAQDQVRFYEIDPQVIKNSQSLFSFTTANPAKTSIQLGDARLVLEREVNTNRSPQCDVLAVDAFTGDSIPIHLLTKQAFDVYAKALSKRGVIAVHISNRYVDLQPVLIRQMENTRWYGAKYSVYSDGLDFTSNWIVMAPRPELIVALGMNNGPLDDNPRVSQWTDDFNNLILSLKVLSPNNK